MLWILLPATVPAAGSATPSITHDSFATRRPPAIQPVSVDARPYTVLAADSGETPVSAGQLLPEMEELNRLSEKLVQDARSGEAHAAAFRIESTLYREGLRALMLNNDRITPQEARIPQVLLLAMVRLSALLHAAAECKTGRYIVCPPELMSRLRAQQATVSGQLEKLGSLPGSSG